MKNMKNMTDLKINDLKKYLKEYNQKELVQLVVDLYKVNKDVQLYLSSKFIGEKAIEELYEQAKRKVQNEFFPERGMPKLRLAEAKKAITTFEKTTRDEARTLDLMLFYVEMGVEFTNAYGDIDDKFYSSMESMFAKVVAKCDNNKTYYDEYSDRLSGVLHDTRNIGWGFHDNLCELYYSIGWELEEEEL